jgi:hypothetical protein
VRLDPGVLLHLAAVLVVVPAAVDRRGEAP